MAYVISKVSELWSWGWDGSWASSGPYLEILFDCAVRDLPKLYMPVHLHDHETIIFSLN